MKRQIRVLLGIVAASGIAQAQNCRFYFGYGDAVTATLNGHAVGDEISTARNLKVLAGGHFNVQVWVEKLNGGPDDITASGGTHIAYDRAVAPNIGEISPAALMHRKLSFGGTNLRTSVTNRVSFANWNNQGQPLDTDSNGFQDVSTLGMPSAQLRGEYIVGSGSTERRVGFGAQYTLTNPAGVGAWFKLGSVGNKVRLLDFEMTNALGVGEIYGDDGLEAGLVLTPKSTATFQAGAHSYFAPNDWPSTTLGSRLIVQAVPEPSGVLALLPGALLLLPRKK
ncbi:MAG: hypothetical protein K8R88_02585 [Armatimonadetes bacterium]|nr:hypothetical protein [Armatimonadota bacterium]